MADFWYIMSQIERYCTWSKTYENLIYKWFAERRENESGVVKEE